MTRIAAYVVLALAAAVALLTAFGPYEDVTFDMNFDATRIGGSVDRYLAQEEAKVPGITPGTEKRVIWAGAPEIQTDWSVLYIHGFSATSEEIRPVPDRVAAGLGANLVFTRLTGHGRGPDAMADGSIEAWAHDVGEALAVASRVGERVLVIATSTGATLATYAATRPIEAHAVAGFVMVSPNYELANPAARLLTWPAARHWVGLIAGNTVSFTPHNAAQAQYWTTSYPTVATLPMAALVDSVNQRDLSAVLAPALFIYSDADQVVDPAATDRIVARWDAQTEVWHPTLTDQDDPFSHLIAGDIMSPNQTQPTVQRILDFAQSLE